jgi:predicted extracellular nuclease
MGDFNDEAENTSISEILGATDQTPAKNSKGLINISARLITESPEGTLSYKGQWSFLDQMIVSSGLLNADHGLFTTFPSVHIFSEDFLIIRNRNNLNARPYPTYSGPKYLGGFSDHLPIYMDLLL